MYKKRIHFLILLFSLVSIQLSAQNNIFSNFRKTLKRADHLFDKHSYTSALELYKHVHEKELDNDYVNLQIAHCLRLLGRLHEADEWYGKLIHGSELIKSVDKLYYAEALLSNGKYVESKKWFLEYLKENSNDSNAYHKMQSLSFLSRYYEDSLSYIVKNVSVNSPESDFSPAYYDKGIVFLSSRKESLIIQNVDALTNESFLDLYYSRFTEKDSLLAPVKFDHKINSKFHEGPVAFYEGGNKIIFTRNNHWGAALKMQGTDRLMLYSADRKDIESEWKNIKQLPFGNHHYSLSHPSYCEATKTLYFVSDMPGGFGGTDIYQSTNTDGSWTIPKNLGPEVNTTENEMFPFIFRNNILCFSSSGHPGLGGLDLYYALLKDTVFASVKNIGYPINTSADDFGLALSPDGTKGYFSSNRENGVGEDDIYSFSIISIPVNGMVVDKLGEIPVDKVNLKLFEKSKEIETGINQDDGKFFFQLFPGKDYILTASKPGYKDFKTYISTRGDTVPRTFDQVIHLERRNKSYVKVFVKKESQLIKDCKIRIVSPHSQNQELTTDNKGEARCEVDADVENIFVAEKDGAAAVHVMKVQKHKKGSMVVNIELDMEPYRIYKTDGILKSEATDLPLAGYDVVVSNLVTKEESAMCSDSTGRFSFDALSYATYDITIKSSRRKTHLHGLIPRLNRTMEIFWDESK